MKKKTKMTKSRSYLQGVTPLIYELSSPVIDASFYISLLTFSQVYYFCSFTSYSLHLVHSVSYSPATLQYATRTPSTVTEHLAVRWSELWSRYKKLPTPTSTLQILKLRRRLRLLRKSSICINNGETIRRFVTTT
jgi:hypothetical protein